MTTNKPKPSKNVNGGREKPRGFCGVVKSLRWDKNYTIVPNEFAQDHSISAFTRSVILDIASRDSAWETTVGAIMHNFSVGRDKARSILSEGQRAGYIYVHKTRNRKTQIDCVTYHISTSKESLKEFVLCKGWENEESYGLKIQGLGNDKKTENPDPEKNPENEMSKTSISLINKEKTEKLGPEKLGPRKLGPSFGRQRKERSNEKKDRTKSPQPPEVRKSAPTPEENGSDALRADSDFDVSGKKEQGRQADTLPPTDAEPDAISVQLGNEPEPAALPETDPCTEAAATLAEIRDGLCAKCDDPATAVMAWPEVERIVLGKVSSGEMASTARRSLTAYARECLKTELAKPPKPKAKGARSGQSAANDKPMKLDAFHQYIKSLSEKEMVVLERLRRERGNDGLKAMFESGDLPEAIQKTGLAMQSRTRLYHNTKG